MRRMHGLVWALVVTIALGIGAAAWAQDENPFGDAGDKTLANDTEQAKPQAAELEARNAQTSSKGPERSISQRSKSTRQPANSARQPVSDFVRGSPSAGPRGRASARKRWNASSPVAVGPPPSTA